MGSDSCLEVPSALRGGQALRRARARRAGLAALALLVGISAAASLAFGTAVSSAAGDLEAAVEHPRVLLSGSPTPLHISADVPAGAKTVTVDVCRSLLDDLDFQNWYPNPDSETGDIDSVRYTFAAPPATTFEVRLDARSQPDLAPGQLHCGVDISSGGATSSAELSLWILP